MTVTLTIALAMALWKVPHGEDQISGRSTHYAPRLMATVAANRGMDLVGFQDGVALNRAGDLGRKVWLEWSDGTIDGPMLVVDCARRTDAAERERQGYVVEVSAELAGEREFYMLHSVPVVVWFVPPPGVLPGKWPSATAN
jgi:hypothetical protein